MRLDGSKYRFVIVEVRSIQLGMGADGELRAPGEGAPVMMFKQVQEDAYLGKTVVLLYWVWRYRERFDRFWKK